MAIIKINRENANHTITDALAKAECKKWGLEFPPTNPKEKLFIWDQLAKMLGKGEK